MSLQILLVDDEPAIKIGFRQLTDWSKTPYTICGTASNGEEALAYIRANPVDIIITDLKMSVMDGIGLIRALVQEHCEIPVMVLSNYSDFELVREALTLGAVDYLLKANISADLLLEHLDKITVNLQNRQKDREESLRQKQLLEVQNTKLFLNELHDFFLDEMITPEDLSETTAAHPLFLQQNVILTLFFHEDIKREKLKRIASNIQTLLTETLSLPTAPLSIMTHHNEILYCVPDNETLIDTLPKKGRTLMRQIATYFGIHPVLCCSDPVTGLSGCRTAYLSCIRARRISFYSEESSLLFTRDIDFISDIPHEEISAAVGAVCDFLLSGRQEDAFRYLHKTLYAWADLRLDPLCLISNCAQILESASFSLNTEITHAQLEDYQQKLLLAKTLPHLETTLLEALSLMQKERPATSQTYKKEVQLAMCYVNAHYQEQLTLDEIAHAANLNKSYLCRLFKKEYGDSVFNYLNAIRMEKAAEMLRGNPKLYIQEVAAAVGILEPFYFTRRFKEYFGVSPRDFVIGLARSQTSHS